MNSKISLVLSALTAAALIGLGAVGCSDPESAVGSGVAPPHGGTFESVVLNADTAVSYASPPVRMGGSQHLYVGNAYGVSSEALVRFEPPSQPTGYALDTTRIAEVRFAYEGGIGPDLPVQIGLSQLDLSWLEFDSLTLPGAGSMHPPVSVGDTGSISDRLTTAWLRSWTAWGADSSLRDTSRQDSGLTIKIFAYSQAGNRLVRFRSRSAIEADSTVRLRPRLYLPVTITDSTGTRTDTLTLFPSADMFIVTYDTAFAGGELIVGSGVCWRALLRFDLSSIYTLQDSSDIVVNRAVLTLHRKPLPEPWPITPVIWPFRLTSDTWLTNPALMEHTMFTIHTTAVDSAAETVETLVTPAVTEWAKGAADNHGLSLNSSGVGLDLDRIAFHGPGDPDPSASPKLTVYYTRLPK